MAGRGCGSYNKINMNKNNNKNKTQELTKYYKICVSGAAETDHCVEGTLDKAMELGREIIRQGGVLITGATSGIPYWAAKGAKEVGGFSIGLSPAFSERDHIERYHLPTDLFDIIIYTGFKYSGRNLLLTRAADAVIFACGRMGTLNEFTITFEDNKPIGVLEGTGGTADMLRDLISKMHRGPGKIVYDSDPKKLVKKLIELIDKEKKVLEV